MFVIVTRELPGTNVPPNHCGTIPAPWTRIQILFEDFNEGSVLSSLETRFQLPFDPLNAKCNHKQSGLYWKATLLISQEGVTKPRPCFLTSPVKPKQRRGAEKAHDRLLGTMSSLEDVIG